MTIHITTEDASSAIAAELITELSADLSARYGDDGGADFDPASVRVPRAAFVVAWLDDKAVGCGALRPTDDDTIIELKRVYVRPSERGKGISRQIMGKLEALARDFGYTKVILETGIYQPEAIGLYESLGYERTECHPPYSSDPLSVCFQKSL